MPFVFSFVFVRGALPGGVRVAEVDREPVDEGFGVSPRAHLAVLEKSGHRRPFQSATSITSIGMQGSRPRGSPAFYRPSPIPRSHSGLAGKPVYRQPYRPYRVRER